MGGKVRITDGIRGGELAASYAINGIGVSAALTGDQYKRPVFDGEQQRFGGGIDIGLRASLFGLAKQDVISHWLDIGGAIGGGGGLIYPARLTTYAEGWVGGWMTIGLAPGTGYPSLVLDVRRQAVTDWNNETLFSIHARTARRIRLPIAKLDVSSRIATNRKATVSGGRLVGVAGIEPATYSV